MMTDNKWGVVPEQARVLAELEQSTGVELRLVNHLTRNGVLVEYTRVIGLRIVSPNLTVFPEAILTLHSLKDLSLSGQVLGKGGVLGSGVKKVPAGIGELQSLESLALEENGLQTLPRSIGRLQRLQKLYLEGNEFRAVPRCISTLYALRQLDLSSNPIRSIPLFVFKLPSLRRLSIDQMLLDSRSVALLYENKRLWFNPELHYDDDERTRGGYMD